MKLVQVGVQERVVFISKHQTLSIGISNVKGKCLGATKAVDLTLI